MIRFTLYSRSWCHLCEDMLAALRAFPVGEAHEVEVVDVDADPALVARYDELVPVLVAERAGQGARELFHYHFDPAVMAQYLSTGGAGRTDQEDRSLRPTSLTRR